MMKEDTKSTIKDLCGLIISFATALMLIVSVVLRFFVKKEDWQGLGIDDTLRVASSKFHDVMFVNWKAQLDSLINSGTPRSDLCTDDNVKHCKPLAGYVAAFMLYRNMFGKNPPAISGTNVPQSEVQKLSAFTSSYTPPKSGAAPTFTGEVYIID